MSQELVNAIAGMREEEALNTTTERLESGENPLDILIDCRKAMEIVGQRFADGEAFIPELIMAGEMLEKIMDEAKPYLEETGGEDGKLGTIVFGTVEGDIHDIAKDIVAFMLDINGFEVVDLGVDVPPQEFVDAVEEHDAKIVGLSGFLTLAYDPMKATVEALDEAGLEDVKVMIGGGQVDEHVRDYAGADAWGRDAVAAVSIAKSWA